MTRLILLFLFAGSIALSAQTQISGKVLTQKGEPLVGANVFIANSYDGSSTNAQGTFSFSTTLSGMQTLSVSSLGFESQSLEVNCQGAPIRISVNLKEAFNKLKAVTITAGSIVASDEAKEVLLKPLDIVTTAGAMGDITGALNTLPGTATVGNDGRLFVRGGAANETAVFFDGLKVNNAYGSSLSGIPTRNRFSPQLFSGTFFSTGGYSAEYGQALSSVLVLNTADMPVRSQTDLSLMTVGGSASHTEVWEKTSLTASLNYLNLSPYQSLVPQNLKWEKAPQGLNSDLLLRQKVGKHGLVKAFYSNQQSVLGVHQAQPGSEDLQKVALNNNFNYANLSYRQKLNAKWLLNSGFSYGHNKDNIQLDSLAISQQEQLAHAKVKVQYFAHNRLSIKAGAEQFWQNFSESLNGHSRGVNLALSALHSEATYHLNGSLALRAGLRAEASAQDQVLNPRISAAYQIKPKHNLSLAYGGFAQQQNLSSLTLENNLAMAQSEHWVAHYQYSGAKRTLRAEAFLKNYRNLERRLPQLNTQGIGFAQGVDFFYRDRASVKNLDFWVSYSLIHSRRSFGNFSQKVQPGFAPQHNFSVVGKYWLQALHSQVGASFSANDGYTYHNPNLDGQMQGKTPGFASLNLNWSYLPQQNLIIHFEVSNVLGRDNIFGYRYSNAPNINGKYASLAQGQTAPRFFFIGVFYTLSANKNANQLNNL